MKFSVSTYSFHSALQAGAIAFNDIPAWVKQKGFDAVELAQAGLPEGVTGAAIAPSFKAACAAAGLPIVNYTVAGNMLVDDQDAEIRRLMAQVDVAAALGAPGMRHDCCYGPKPEAGLRTWEQALPVVARGCRAVAEYAAAKGVRTMVENHGLFAQDSARVEQLVAAVDHPNFGLLVDMGNFMCVDEDGAMAVGRVAALAFHVHAKDFFLRSGQRPDPGMGWFTTRAGNRLRGTIVGHGDVPVGQCLHILQAAGYEGYVSIEFEGIEEPLMAIEQGLYNLKRLAP